MALDVIEAAVVSLVGPNTVALKVDYTSCETGDLISAQIAMPISVAKEMSRMFDIAVASASSPPPQKN